MPDMKTLTINGITYNINDNNLNNLLDGSAIGSLHSINSNESNSYTIGQYATALGGDVKASGNFSTALNFGTTAAGNSQTVIGKYNIIDTNDTSAFIIGNGTADDARSNALTVDWKGWVSLYHNDAIVNTTPTIPSKTSYREIMFRDGSFVYTDTHRTGMIGNSVDANGTIGPYIKAIRLNATAGPNGSTEVAIGAYYPLTGDPYVHAGKKLVIGGVTEASNAYGSANPILEFRNNAGDGSQNIQLVFTDFDSVQYPTSLTLAGNQGKEYFIAPNIKATTALYAGTAKFLATKSQTLTVNSSYVSAGSITVMRKGVMVNLHGTGVTTRASAGWNTNLLNDVLPADYRPRAEVYFASSTGNQHLKVTVQGALSFVGTTAATSGMYFDVTYMANS